MPNTDRDEEYSAEVNERTSYCCNECIMWFKVFLRTVQIER